jgi:hypothetical protein
MTLEKAADLVKNASTSDDRIALYCHFEETLNPHQPKNQDNSWNERCANWQSMFAEMCGFALATNVQLKNKK